MKAVIEPGKLKGTVTAPWSKSVAHRMLICAALAEGRSELQGISLSEDMRATLDCIRALGAGYEREGDVVSVTGIGTPVKTDVSLGSAGATVFPCRESGSTLRFFIPVSLAACAGGCFTGADRLMERGIGIYEELFHNAGIRLEAETGADGRKARIRAEGVLKSGTYRVRGDVSSQFITGLLFALPLLREDSRIEVLPPVESRAYIDITIDTMKRFGVEVRETQPNCFLVPGGQTYQARRLQVEGDWSNAAFLYALNALGHELEIRGLNADSLQGDKACVQYLEQLGGRKDAAGGAAASPETSGTLCGAAAEPETLGAAGSMAAEPETLGAAGSMAAEPETSGAAGSVAAEPETSGAAGSVAAESETSGRLELMAGTITGTAASAGRGPVAGGQAAAIDISNTPDLGPVLFAAAAALNGGRFTGTRRLRIKESDRAAAMKEELEKFGITCRVGENEVVIEPGRLKKPEVSLNGHNDHRIVMALSVLASLTGAQIEDAQAVNKSWPDFYEKMQKIGMKVRFV